MDDMTVFLFDENVTPFAHPYEQELVRHIPAEFQKGNKWTDAANAIFFSGSKVSNWKWKTKNEKERSHQFKCFRVLLSSWNLKHEQKQALCGWALSEMLTSPPQ